MSLTVLGWVLIASSIAISALALVPLGSGRPRGEAFDLTAWLRQSGWRYDEALRGAAGILVVTLAVFLFVAGVGAATTFFAVQPDLAPMSETDEDVIARLDDYVRSIGAEPPTAKAADGTVLPDVNTMIERLAKRLESAPDDVRGWRMLGWSYLNTGLYPQAVAAYAKAVALDPTSEESARALEDAKAKAAEGEGVGEK